MKRFLDVLAGLFAAVSLIALVAGGAAARQATPVGTGGGADLEAATAWLVEQQLEEGGFPGFSGESDPSMTIDAILALVAADHAGVETGDAIDQAVAYLESDDVALVYAQTGVGQAAKLVLATVATGGDPRDIAGVDALALLEQDPTAETGLYGQGVFDHAYVILALVAAGNEVPTAAINALDATQTPEGGWAFDGVTAEGAADSNTTALVVQALEAAGEGDSPLVEEATTYLMTTIEGTAGAVFQPGGQAQPDSSSTAFVIQALVAVGDDPSSEAWGNLLAALGTFQNDSGAFHFNADDMMDNIFSTAQAIPAAAGVALPVVPTADAAIPIALLTTDGRASGAVLKVA